MKTSINYRKFFVNWHNTLGWWGLTAIVIWVLSGAAHPIMSWLGPKADKFFPPSMVVEAEQLKGLPTLLSTQSVLDNARVVKVVPSKNRPLLQVTTDDYAPREYFNLTSGEKIHNYDTEQAKWLASYYTGRAIDDIASIKFQTQFDDSYPWVNRLLPVYNIHFKGDDNLRIFVHTETSAMAGLNNQLKSTMQWLFQHLHTFKWLNAMEYGRLIIVSLFMFCLMATAILGLLLIFALKSRKIKHGNRRYHRWLGYVLWLPLLAWSASGFYHLLQSSLLSSPTGIRLGETFSTSQQQSFSSNMTWLNTLAEKQIHHVSLVQDKNSLYYRLSIANTSAKEVSRTQRYKGMPTEKQAVFVDAISGQISAAQNDRQQAQQLAAHFTQTSLENIGETSLITRFGPDYDFRNKRLPVWKVEINDNAKTWLFIDPVTGVLVDQSESFSRVESWSFSFLHKWNFLTPFTGRMLRDVLIVVCLGFLLAISLLGATLLLARAQNANKRRTPIASN